MRGEKEAGKTLSLSSLTRKKGRVAAKCHLSLVVLIQ